MAADDLTTRYCLTSNGWTVIYERFFDSVKQDDPRPEDTVEEWEVREYNASMWSPTEYTWNMRYSNPRLSETQRDAIRRRFHAPATQFPAIAKARRRSAPQRQPQRHSH